jgi:hypothetical protein
LHDLAIGIGAGEHGAETDSMGEIVDPSEMVVRGLAGAKAGVADRYDFFARL